MVQGMYLDYNKNLWCAVGSGVKYIELNTPFTEMKELYNIDHKIYAITEHDGYLYAGGEPSIYSKKIESNEDLLNRKPFHEIENSGSQTWDFLSAKGKLLASHTKDLLVTTPTSFVKRSAGKMTVFTAFESNINKDYVLCGTYRGIEVTKYVNGDWVYQGKLKGFNTTARWIRQDKEGNI